MFKLASFALIAAVGTVGIAQACPTVGVGVGVPVTIVPRIAFAPVVYDHDWRRWREGYWRHERDRYRYGHYYR